jgi:hypothetical protein
MLGSRRGQGRVTRREIQRIRFSFCRWTPGGRPQLFAEMTNLYACSPEPRELRRLSESCQQRPQRSTPIIRQGKVPPLIPNEKTCHHDAGPLPVSSAGDANNKKRCRVVSALTSGVGRFAIL